MRPFTILLTPASNVLFHVGRCVALGRELARRGHRAILAGEPRYLCDPGVAADAECEYAPLPDFSPETGMALLRSIRTRPDPAEVEALIAAEVALLDELEPDLVVTDFRPSMWISARLRGVPLAGLVLAHWLPGYARDPEWVPRTYGIGRAVRRLLGERQGRHVTSPVFRAVIRHKTRSFRAAARARGLDAPAVLWDYLLGDVSFLTDVHGESRWSGGAATAPLPPGCRAVGPILWEPRVPLPESLLRIEEGLPRIYVTCGSTGVEALFARVFEELADGPWQVVVSTGGQLDLGGRPPPANFAVERLVPGLATMRAADLVIYHGGAGTFQHALRTGLPGIVIATHWDQEYAGFVSEREGVGAFLTLRDVLSRPGCLRRATEDALARLPAHRERARRLGERLPESDAAKLAAEGIETFLRARAAGAE